MSDDIKKVSNIKGEGMNTIGFFVSVLLFFFVPLHAGASQSKPSNEESHHISINTSEQKKENEENSVKKKEITINITVAPNVNQTVVTKTSAGSSSKSTSISSAYAYLENSVKNVVNMLQSMTMENVSKDFAHCIGPYKWHILLITPVATYCGFCSFLIGAHYFMQNRAVWARWKRHLSVEELNHECLDEAKKKQFMQNLIDDIFKCHLNPNEPTNHISPLVQFIAAVEREMKLINRYLLLANVISKTRIIKLFPTNDKKIAHAQECKQRLSFVKHLFVAWTATYNLSQLGSTRIIH